MTWGAAGRFRSQVGQGDLVAVDEDKIARWASALFDVRNEERLAYWTDYRLVPGDILSELQIGWDSRRRRYTIPVRDARGRCVDVKLYRPGEKEFGKSLHYTEKSKGEDDTTETMAWGKPPRLWGLDRVAAASPGKGRAGVVVLCAGEPDAIVATALGYLAVSPTSGEGSLCRQQDAEVLKEGGWPVRLLFDTDDAGRKAAGVWARALLEFGIENLKDVELEFPNGDGKDLSEWVREGEWGRTGDFRDPGVALWAAIRASVRLDIGNLGGAGDSGGDAAGDQGAGANDGSGTTGNGTDDNGPAGRANETRRPVAELIDMALTVELPRKGSRNWAGFWLWCQMRDERYSKDEAIAMVAEWVEVVNAATSDKGHPYTQDESRLSLDEAYSSAPRDANGKGLAYPLTDLGNSERLVARHGADMAWVPAWHVWTVWTGRSWEGIGGGDSQVGRWAASVPRMMYEEGVKLSRRARKVAGDKAKEDPAVKEAGKLMSWARASESAGKISAMVALARNEKVVSGAMFDQKNDLFGVQNGTVILGRDGEIGFKGHDRADLITFCAPVEYIPGAVGEQWERFMKETLPDDDLRQYVQKLVGYSLVGGNPDRKFIIVHGPTASGKSTFSNVLQTVLGDYAQVFKLSLMREKQDEGPRVDLLTVLPARMIFASEASDSWYLHADQVKHITGNEPVTARGMHAKAYVTRVPAFTPWLLTNQIPQVKGADAALWRRLIAVPFGETRAIGSEDRDLAERIGRQEAAGVLAWALEGYRAYVAEGLDDMPLAVLEHTATVRDQLTDLDAWLAECTEGGAEYSEFTSVLYENYSNWCMTNYVHERDKLGLRAFGKSLGNRGYVAGRRVRPPEGGNPANTWGGLRIRVVKEEAGKSSN